MAKILAFAGSNSSNSINQQVVEIAASLLDQTHEVEVLNITGWDVPMYSSAVEDAHGVPQIIQGLKVKIKDADILLMSSPEHNSSIPAFFKNIIDWLSRMEGKTFEEKPAFLMGVSPGGRGAKTNLASLATLYPWWGGGEVLGTFSLAKFYDNVKDGQLEASKLAELKEALKVLDK